MGLVNGEIAIQLGWPIPTEQQTMDIVDIYSKDINGFHHFRVGAQPHKYISEMAKDANFGSVELKDTCIA